MADQKPTPVAETQAYQRSASGTVTVACKIGVPWIDFQACEEVKVMENTQTGAREITQYAKTGRVIRIRGTSYPRGQIPEGFPERPEIVDGYALTRNINKETWDLIAEQQRKAPYFMSRMIYAFVQPEDGKAIASEHRKDRSGLEPVQRGRDANGNEAILDDRLPRSMNSGVTSVQPGTRATV